MDKVVEIDGRKVSISLFPLIKEQKREFSSIDATLFETYIRKKHTDGKWYLCLFRRCETFPYPKNEIKHYLWREDVIRQININCYIFLQLGHVIPNHKTIDGESDYILDSNQEEEKERIENIFR